MSSIELHIIQNFPPSNLNRDDIGQPKSTDFGGVRRARISSQCQKRAIRLHPAFAKATGVAPSDRTKRIQECLEQAILNSKITTINAEAEVMATLVARSYGQQDGKDLEKDETETLIYVSDYELGELVNSICQRWSEIDWLPVAQGLDQIRQKREEILSAQSNEERKKLYAAIYKSTDEIGKVSAAAKNYKLPAGKKEAKKKVDATLYLISDEIVSAVLPSKKGSPVLSAPDIALFGRMLTARPETNIDAACQVAHAISTHKVGKADIDYYTAMDDVKQRMKDPGAGFLDVAYFNSACFYRYIRIDFAQLEKTLGDHDMAVKTVEGFMRAAEAAVPSGKQNSHAQFTRPSFMLAVLRPDGSDGWNLVNAFEKPIRVTENDEQGLIEKSVQALEARFNHQCQFYGDDAVSTVAVALPDGVINKEHLSKPLADVTKGLNDWVKTITSKLGN